MDCSSQSLERKRQYQVKPFILKGLVLREEDSFFYCFVENRDRDVSLERKRREWTINRPKSFQSIEGSVSHLSYSTGDFIIEITLTEYIHHIYNKSIRLQTVTGSNPKNKHTFLPLLPFTTQ